MSRYTRKTIELTKIYPLLAALAILLALVTGLWLWGAATAPRELLRPIRQMADQAQAMEVEYRLPETVDEEIKAVFGEHSNKAFKLLECENRSRNPKAVSPTGDYGVFQISEHWQKTQKKFLLNPHVNIRVAWQLYEENGYSFRIWTCGKVLGI